MPDRIIRDEILQSDRVLDLPNDTDRWCFIVLLLLVDDFGNTDGHPRRIFRLFNHVAQVKSEEASAGVLLDLVNADLARRYEVAGRAFLHVPRLRPHRQYLVRKWPPSPWDQDRKLGKIQRVEIRGLAKSQALGENIVTTSSPHSSDVAQGVGVGVGSSTLLLTGFEHIRGATENSKPENHFDIEEKQNTENPHRKKWHASEEGIEAKARELGLWPAKVGESYDDLRSRCFALIGLKMRGKRSNA